MRDVVLVVTPSRNAERYLEQTILSVVQQRGEFDIHYHVQDGSSTDSTIAITEAWVERLRAMDGRFYGGAPVQMSWDSATDSSMYDAIQSGFETLYRRLGSLQDRRVAMTWINADDIFAAGAFQSATSFLFENPGQHWVTGIPSTIVEDGTIADVRDAPYAYSRRHLALGRYDGRSRPFFQQEGTLWTSALWSTVGGLNRRLRLAGVWDLWRRMARETSVVTLRAVLAHHRRHPGQLSAQMGPYWSELDSLRTLEKERPTDAPDDGDVGLIAGWSTDSNRWTTYPVDMGGVHELFDSDRARDGDAGLRLDFSHRTMPIWVRHMTGLSEAEPWGRWSDALLAPSARICAIRPFPRKATIRLRLAVAKSECSPVNVTVGAQSFQIMASIEPKDYCFEVDSEAPVDTIDIRPSMSCSPKDLGLSEDRRRLGVALYTFEVLPSSESLST